MTDSDLHVEMDRAYAEQGLTGQALADSKRRHGHFQVRLPLRLTDKVRSFMASRNLNANQALTHIIETFFH